MSNIRSRLEDTSKAANFIPLAERTGKLRIKLTNDYLFKVVFQNDEEVLRALLAALLSRDEDEITEINVTNSIIPGETVNSKTIMLDIKICLNKKEIINIEMQVHSLTDWKQRSIFYLCRAYTNLQEGEGYKDARNAHHIGILDFNLKDLTPEFYSHYKLMNTNNHEIYSGDIELSVLNLKQVDKATEKDKANKLDVWAKIFRATTWEDLKMLAKENEIVNKISDSMYVMTEDERIREQCRLRDDRLSEERYVKKIMAEQVATIAEQNNTIINQANTIDDLTTLHKKDLIRIAELEAMLAGKSIDNL